MKLVNLFEVFDLFFWKRSLLKTLWFWRLVKFSFFPGFTTLEVRALILVFFTTMVDTILAMLWGWVGWLWDTMVILLFFLLFLFVFVFSDIIVKSFCFDLGFFGTFWLCFTYFWSQIFIFTNHDYMLLYSLWNWNKKKVLKFIISSKLYHN